MNSFLKSAFRLIKNYKWNSLFFKYFRVLLFVFIIPAFIFIAVILNLYFSSVKADINTSQRYSIIKSITQYDKAFDAIDTIYKNILESPMTYDIAKNPAYDYAQYAAFLRSEISGLSYINSISVYLPQEDYVISSYGSSVSGKFRDVSWLDTYRSGMAEFALSAKPKGIENSKLINIGHSLIADGKNAGLVIFTIDGETLTDMMHASEKKNDEAVFLFSAQNEPIYISDSDMLSENEAEIFNMIKEATYREETIFSTHGIHYNAISSENHPYKLAVGLNLSTYNKNYSQITSIAILYFALILVLAVLASLIIAFSLYRSIVDVVSVTTALNNDSAARTEDNELIYLSNTLFNTMKNHEQIENELVEKIAKLKKVQSIALQTQINPHFLFNTLNLVNGFILEECRGDSRAATMLSNLSDILYIALNTKDYIVTVETELEYAKKYLNIEQVKYPGKFRVEYNIDPETLGCKTVKFVLQPIIENAIEHGMKRLAANDGVITISTTIMNNLLVLSVEDNGPKISEKTMALLEKRLESDEVQETKHIGLSNVNQRIKLIFGEQYGVSIYSDDARTAVDIIMPDLK